MVYMLQIMINSVTCRTVSLPLLCGKGILPHGDKPVDKLHSTINVINNANKLTNINNKLQLALPTRDNINKTA